MRNRHLVLLIIAVVALLVMALPPVVHRQKSREQTTEARTAAAPPLPQPAVTPHIKSSAVVYAAPGDSLTAIVRRAIRELDQQHTLSKAQVVYAETNMVDGNGRRDALAVGEAVTIDFDELEQIITASRQLTVAQLAPWQPYAAFIDY